MQHHEQNKVLRSFDCLIGNGSEWSQLWRLKERELFKRRGYFTFACRFSHCFYRPGSRRDKPLYIWGESLRNADLLLAVSRSYCCKKEVRERELFSLSDENLEDQIRRKEIDENSLIWESEFLG
jgi:hypothetical protein